ncbi:MAG: hypothetical protein JWN62_305 [Acidimicrobiales bacterium]|nr:hypothetical protein [Acidimicrobiales bacterium]
MSDRWAAPTPSGWFPDPWGAPAMRFWNGVRWTGELAVPPPPPKPAFPTLPISAAVIVLVTTAASLAADKLIVRWLVRFHWPIAVYVLIAACIGYGPLVVACRYVVRRSSIDGAGPGNLSTGIGLRFRRADLGWGPVAWVACYVAEITVALIVLALHIPIVSNTAGLSKLDGNRTYIISFALLAVVAAPIVEEMVFRGVVLRGFRSRFPAWLAVGLQGVLFGAAHFDPERGKGNIGLVMILASVGIVLGGAAYLTRRIAPTMIAHGLFNTLAVILVLTR